jgi:hypothetical protein
MITCDSELTEEVGGASVCKLKACELQWIKIFPRAPLPPGLLDPEHESIT